MPFNRQIFLFSGIFDANGVKKPVIKKRKRKREGLKSLRMHTPLLTWLGFLLADPSPLNMKEPIDGHQRAFLTSWPYHFECMRPNFQ